MKPVKKSHLPAARFPHPVTIAFPEVGSSAALLKQIGLMAEENVKGVFNFIKAISLFCKQKVSM